MPDVKVIPSGLQLVNNQTRVQHYTRGSSPLVASSFMHIHSVTSGCVSGYTSKPLPLQYGLFDPIRGFGGEERLMTGQNLA